MNIETTLNKATNILKDHKIITPYLDSEILLSQAINKDRKYIILNAKENLRTDHLNSFNDLVERRKKGEPIAYLINKKEFWKDEFYVDRNVLIPRPDTEIIVDQVLRLSMKNSQLKLLDIGTGSGCILLSLLKERPNFYGTGIDISKKSINVCKYNAKILHLTNRVKFYNSDVDNFKIGKYDIIVSNPPYIKLSSLKYLVKDVIKFEPKLALSGGFDGFSEIRKVISKAKTLIKKMENLFWKLVLIRKIKQKKCYKKKVFI